MVDQANKEKQQTLLKEKVPENGIGGHLGINGDDASPDDLVPCMHGKQVVDARVDLVKVVVYLLEAAPLGEVCGLRSAWRSGGSTSGGHAGDFEVVAYHSDDLVPVMRR